MVGVQRCFGVMAGAREVWSGSPNWRATARAQRSGWFEQGYCLLLCGRRMAAEAKSDIQSGIVEKVTVGVVVELRCCEELQASRKSGWRRWLYCYPDRQQDCKDGVLLGSSRAEEGAVEAGHIDRAD